MEPGVTLSIRWKLILAIAAPLLLIYLLSLAVIVTKLREQGVREQQRQQVALVSSQADRLDARFAEIARIADATASLLTRVGGLTEEHLFSILEGNVAGHELVYGSCIAFVPEARDGQRRLFAPYVHRSGSTLVRVEVASEAYDYADGSWEWYSAPEATGQPIWTDPFFDEGAGDIVMCTYSAPFFRDGAFAGVATVDVPIDELQHHPELASLREGMFLILSRNGWLVSEPGTTEPSRRTIFEVAADTGVGELAEVGRRMLDGGTGVLRTTSLIPDQPTWLAYAPIRSTGWSLGTGTPEDEVLQFQRDQLKVASVGLAVTLILMIGSVWWVGTRLVRPIERLSKAVSNVGEGNLTADVSLDMRGDEIGALAAAFNRMVADLRRYVSELTHETKAREAVESELRVARQIQRSLLPQKFPPFPEKREFDLYAENRAARRVAGDFYDFDLIDGQLYFAIGDVSGKGVPAALFMAVTRTLLRNLVRSETSPGQVLASANELLRRDNVGSLFVTLFLGFYDIESGVLRYANAGHPRPVLVSKCGGAVQVGEVTGTILGILESESYGDGELRLSRGESLVVYTDGVTDALAAEGEFFGEQRMLDSLARHALQGEGNICQSLVNDVEDFQGPKRHDDITVLVIRRN